MHKMGIDFLQVSENGIIFYKKELKNIFAQLKFEVSAILINHFLVNDDVNANLHMQWW